MATASKVQINSAVHTLGPVPVGTLQKAIEVLTHVEGSANVRHMWGYDPNVNNTEHHSGLALDFMLYSITGTIDTALGYRIRAYLWANRKRLGVRHIIYRQTIISTVVDPGVTRRMNDRGNPTANHMDHVHVMFLNSSYIKPGSVSTFPYRLDRKSRNRYVKDLQRQLNSRMHPNPRLTIDGIYGPMTENAVSLWQRQHLALRHTGIVDKRTWDSIFS